MDNPCVKNCDISMITTGSFKSSSDNQQQQAPDIFNASFSFAHRIDPSQLPKSQINKSDSYNCDISHGKPHYEIDPWSENNINKACNNLKCRSVSKSSALTFHFISDSFH